MSENLITTISDALGPRHYAALLVSLAGLTVIAPLVEHYFWARVFVTCLMIFSLLTAVLVVSPNGRVTAKPVLLAVFSAAMWALAFSCNISPFNTICFGLAAYTVTLLFFVTTCSIMTKDVFSGSVTVNRICGAVCIYILIGFCFAIVHMMVYLANASAYKGEALSGQTQTTSEPLSAEKRYPLFVYFSFCTMSTVGYGDMIPASRLARSLSWIESLAGQLYLTILVARLVGLHIAGATLASVDVSRYSESKREFESSRR
jgi:voltage-gated potassium channel